RCTNFCINCTSLARFAPSFVQWQNCSKMHPNGEKRTQHMSLGSNGMDRERSLQKILTRHRGTNFCINCTSLARFAASFVQQRNGSKCIQMDRNAPKYEFRVLCRSGAFVLKNSNKTLLHEL